MSILYKRIKFYNSKQAHICNENDAIWIEMNKEIFGVRQNDYKINI